MLVPSKASFVWRSSTTQALRGLQRYDTEVEAKLLYPSDNKPSFLHISRLRAPMHYWAHMSQEPGAYGSPQPHLACDVWFTIHLNWFPCCVISASHVFSILYGIFCYLDLRWSHCSKATAPSLQCTTHEGSSTSCVSVTSVSNAHTDTFVCVRATLERKTGKVFKGILKNGSAQVKMNWKMKEAREGQPGGEFETFLYVLCTCLYSKLPRAAT